MSTQKFARLDRRKVCRLSKVLHFKVFTFGDPAAPARPLSFVIGHDRLRRAALVQLPAGGNRSLSGEFDSEGVASMTTVT